MVDPSLAEFLQQGLSIHLGTRDDHLQPFGARALALTVEADGRHLVVYLARSAAERLIPHLESHGQLAVVVARPEDDRSCQVKGTTMAIRPAEEAEREIIERQWTGFMNSLERIGIPSEATARWTRWPALAIRLRATAVFDQTPGPQAGTAAS